MRLSASFKTFYLFYFWLHWVFVAARGCSLVAGVGPLFAAVNGFSFRWLLVEEHSLGVQAQELWGMGLVALRNVESSWSRDQTRVPFSTKQILFFFFFKLWLHRVSVAARRIFAPWHVGS